MTQHDYLSAIESGIRHEIASICGCSSDALPASLTCAQAMKFFNIANPRTFHVWKSTGRHDLVWLKRGRLAEIVVESAIQHRLNSVEIPEAEA